MLIDLGVMTINNKFVDLNVVVSMQELQVQSRTHPPDQHEEKFCLLLSQADVYDDYTVPRRKIL